jgi:hypothetical protein
MKAFDESKAMLTADVQAELVEPHAMAVPELLPEDPRLQKPNVIGVGIGVKEADGELTGEPALLVLVTHKVSEDELRSDELIPSTVQDISTDVVEIGEVVAEQFMPEGGDGGAMATQEAPLLMSEVGIQTLTKRVRPAEGGYSVGHKDITAGTIATAVYDILPGGTISPPAPGVGIPARYFILSNNHVLANSNAGAIGDPVLQPGPFDGGFFPADVVARLSRFIPITFEPPMPRAFHRNLVDAALAEAAYHDIDREIHWVGNIRAWRRKANVTVGTLVQKSGRTTNYTVGRVIAVNATIDVGYGGGRVARFLDQIVTTNMSAGGDSGSLISTLDEVAVGLLFAGSSVATIANQIENVRALLRVEVAEQIL